MWDLSWNGVTISKAEKFPIWTILADILRSKGGEFIKNGCYFKSACKKLFVSLVFKLYIPISLAIIYTTTELKTYSLSIQIHK